MYVKPGSAGFTDALAKLLFLPDSRAVELPSIRAASVLIDARATTTDAATAASGVTTLSSTSLPILSAALGVEIEAVSAVRITVIPPSLVSPLTILPLRSNPVALAIIVLLLFDALSLYTAQR